MPLTKIYNPRATGSLRHFMLYVFCATLKPAPLSVNSSTPVYRLGCQRSALLAFNPIHQVFIILWIRASKKRRSSSSEAVFSVVVHKLMQTHFQSFHRTFGKRNVNFLYQRHESPILCSKIQKKGHK